MKKKLLNIFAFMMITVFMFIPFINVNAEEGYTGIAFGTSAGGSYSVGLETDKTASMNMTVNIGETITIKATPDEGYTFVGWYKGIIGDSHFVESYDSNTLISTNATYSFTVTNETPSTFYAVFKDNSSANDNHSPKKIYIDNTVDSSRSYVTGEITLKNLKTGKTTTETVYSKDFAVIYSNPKDENVQNAINTAYNIVQTKTTGKYSNVNISTNETAGKVWDNRRYTVVQDGDAILIGDADYISGAYGINNSYSITFIADGDYGKSTYYKVTATAEYWGDEEYEILNGANGEYTIDSNKDLTVRANGNIDNFVGLKVDGKTLDAENYTIKSGSTIATLKSSYLNTLSVGTHTLTFVYNDGNVETNFTIKKASNNITTNPQTSDNIISQMGLLFISLMGLTTTGIYLRKNTPLKDN